MNCSDSRPESVGKQSNTLSCPALNVAFTGHRADSLPWGFNESSDECLKLKAGLLRAIRCAYAEGKRCFLSGMASGVDIYAAEAVLQLRETLPGIALVCVFPCPSRDSRSAAIAAAADSVIVLSSEYCAGCMKRRNRFLVENASMLIAVYDGRRTGGTFQTVGMAARRGLRTVILNPTAKRFDSSLTNLCQVSEQA